MNSKRNIIFTLEKRKKEGVLVVEHIIYNGKRINAAKWDESQQKVRNGGANKLKQSASEINADLLRFSADIQEIFKGFVMADSAVSVAGAEHRKNDLSEFPEADFRVNVTFNTNEDFGRSSMTTGQENCWFAWTEVLLNRMEDSERTKNLSTARSKRP